MPRCVYGWLMLGREPRSANELVMIYAGVLAHGTALPAAGIPCDVGGRPAGALIIHSIDPNQGATR